MAGAKRLAQIQGNRMAEIYCTNLLRESSLFNVYDSTEEGFDSVAETNETCRFNPSLHQQQHALAPG